MEKIIEVNGLEKSYGSLRAVNGIDFYVERGKTFSLLGPNGAGKSTTIDIICTFLEPDAGTVTVAGNRLGKQDENIRNSIGVVFQDGLLDKLLTIEENLRVRGGFYGLRGKELDKRVKETARISGVTELLKRPYGNLSGGQRRRCDIARALINTPQILILDEPTTGLDPQTRKNVWETIYRIKEENNMTIFLTTHYMEEAAQSDYVIILDNGRIAAKGTPSELKEKYSKDKLILVSSDFSKTCAVLDAAKTSYTVSAETLSVTLDSTMEALPVIESVRESISGFEVLRGTMDDAFIAITGKEIRE